MFYCMFYFTCDRSFTPGNGRPINGGLDDCGYDTGLLTCYSAAYVRQTQAQKCFTISEAVIDSCQLLRSNYVVKLLRSS